LTGGTGADCYLTAGAGAVGFCYWFGGDGLADFVYG